MKKAFLSALLQKSLSYINVHEKGRSDRIKWACNKAKPFNKGKFICDNPCPQNTEDVSIQALIKTSDSVQEYKGTLNIGKTYTDTECRLNGQLT